MSSGQQAVESSTERALPSETQSKTYFEQGAIYPEDFTPVGQLTSENPWEGYCPPIALLA